MPLKERHYFFYVVSDAHVGIYQVLVYVGKKGIPVKQKTVSNHREEQCSTAEKRFMEISKISGGTYCVEQLWQQLPLATCPL